MITNLRVALIGKFKENHNIKSSLIYATHCVGVILNAYPREDFKDYPSLNDDIIEIGLTPNRGDCLSILGVARELKLL